jgi:competence protein ComEC
MIRKYPSVFLLIFIVGGIVAGDRSQFAPTVFLTAALGCCLIGMLVLSRGRRLAATLLLALGLATFSAFHYGQRYLKPGPRHLIETIRPSERYRIYGRVSDWPDLRPDRTEIRINVDSLAGRITRRVHGALLLKVSDTTTILQRGDRVEFSGRIYPLRGRDSPGRFDYHRYLNHKGVFGIVYLPTLLDVRVDRRWPLGLFGVIDRLRDAIRKSLRRNLPPREAALACGFLIGETRDIPVSIYAMFRDSGTLHLLAVSGSNVALVLLFIVFIMRPFHIPQRRRALIMLLVILVFAELSYEEPSVIRASLMAALVIAAGLLKRRYDLNNIIATTAVIVLLVDPAQLYDVGFQLSFVTAWGLIFVVPRVADRLQAIQGRRWYTWLVFPLVVSLVAQIASMPIVAYHFGRVPAVSVIANLVIVPLVSVGVIGVLVLLLVDLIWPLMGMLVGSLLGKLLGLVISALELMGGDSMPVISVSRLMSEDGSLWLIMLTYGVLATAAWSLGRRLMRRLAPALILVAVNGALLAAIVNGPARQGATIDFRRVPGGVAALVRGDRGASSDLILTGLSERNYPIDEKILMPWFEEAGLDTVNLLFVVSADFGAVDDILRTAEALHVTEIWARDDLRHAFADVRARFDSLPAARARVRFWPQSMAGSCDTRHPGYYPRGPFLTVEWGKGRVLFADRLKSLSLVSTVAEKGDALVIGSKWRPSPVDWTALRARGIGAVVCSNIEPQFITADFEAAMETAEAMPDDLYDLKRLGSVRLLVSDWCLDAGR